MELLVQPKSNQESCNDVGPRARQSELVEFKPETFHYSTIPLCWATLFFTSDLVWILGISRFTLRANGVVLNQAPLELQSSVLTTKSFPHTFINSVFIGVWGTDFSAIWKGESALRGVPLVDYKQFQSFHWEQILQYCYFFLSKVTTYNFIFCEKFCLLLIFIGQLYIHLYIYVYIYKTTKLFQN